ncbi:hypothetical protein GGF32_005342 [Allomyces javanicus]|nr:hypothetical protein GGF32_005342 [Allomyces javanicus]
MYVFSVVLVGTTKTTFANLPVPGAYTIMVSAVDVDGPVACFVVTKNNIERHGLVNTLAHIKSSSGDALGLTWRANEGLSLSKSGLTFDGTYRVKILKMTGAASSTKSAPKASTKAVAKTTPKAAGKKTKAASPASGEASAPADTDAPAEDRNERSFTVTQVLCEGQDTSECVKGRFISKNPAGACRKAANKIFKKLFQDGESAPIEIHVRETTKGSKNGEFKYTATRSLIDKREVAFKTQTGETTTAIPFKYDIRVTSLNNKKKTTADPVETEDAAEAE